VTAYEEETLNPITPKPQNPKTPKFITHGKNKNVLREVWPKFKVKYKMAKT
jgi:hypothetical protein